MSHYSNRQRFTKRTTIVMVIVIVAFSILGWVFILLRPARGSLEQSSPPSSEFGHSGDKYCKSLDFGGDNCQVNVQIYNDTNTTYTIKQCSGSFHTPQCKAFAKAATLAPGASQEANGTTEKDSAQPWLVMDQSGNIAGCLSLQFTLDQAQAPSVTVPLSKLISCKQFLRQ